MAGLVHVEYDLSDFDSFYEEIFRKIFQQLVELGESAYNEAVLKGRYNNITGNLRSSLGYVVAQDGRVVKEGGFKRIQGRGENYQNVLFTTKVGKKVQFWAHGKSGDGSEGSKKGLEYARTLATSMKGITLVVVAGMDYASFVNTRGLDVIDSAELHVIRELK